jgi:hypothetical protein
VLPLLSRELDSRLDECRFAGIKWLTDVVQQLVADDLLAEARARIAALVQGQLLPRLKKALGEPNPTGSAMIKLLRTVLDFEPEFRDALFGLDIPAVLLKCFESRRQSPVNHEKCNANTIKVISYLVDCPKMKLPNLAADGFFDKLLVLYSNISDLVQGEEIVELLNVFFRRIFKELKIDIYDLEQTRKVWMPLTASTRRTFLP